MKNNNTKKRRFYSRNTGKHFYTDSCKAVATPVSFIFLLLLLIDTGAFLAMADAYLSLGTLLLRLFILTLGLLILYFLLKEETAQKEDTIGIVTSLLEGLPVAAAVIDDAGQVEFANPSLLERLSENATRFTGISLIGLISDKESDEFVQWLRTPDEAYTAQVLLGEKEMAFISIESKRYRSNNRCYYVAVIEFRHEMQ